MLTKAAYIQGHEHAFAALGLKLAYSQSYDIFGPGSIEEQRETLRRLDALDAPSVPPVSDAAVARSPKGYMGLLDQDLSGSVEAATAPARRAVPAATAAAATKAPAAATAAAKPGLLSKIRANPGKAGLAAGALLGGSYLAGRAAEPPQMEVIPSAPVAPMFP